MAQKLPIGISSLAKIKEQNCVYIDKTSFAVKLVDSGSAYFLSRPRRFGKSLFVDTLKELFEGNRSLFEGLYAEKHWDWSKTYPVLSFSFGRGTARSVQELEGRIRESISHQAEIFGLKAEEQDIPTALANLLENLHQSRGERVVVLIDEYDKPILDQIENLDLAKDLREALKNFYSVLKDSDAHLKFTFLTGVTKFSKVSLFSGLNHLEDISLDARYGDICGYTEEDLNNQFLDFLQGVDRAELKRWYNGYCWLSEPVYNPFDILLFISKGHEYRAHWFETGSPAFLQKVAKQRSIFLPDFENLYASEALLGSFDIEQIEMEALLFQTGYLTIKSKEKLGSIQNYRLGLPNQEVRMALNSHLLAVFCDTSSSERSQIQAHLYQALAEGKPHALEAELRKLFSSISHHNYTNNPVANYEGYYASVIYAYFASLGLSLIAEDTTNKGRIDLSILLEDRVWVMEFKVDQKEGPSSENLALKQIKEKKYASKYISDGVCVHLVGIHFSPDTKNISLFEATIA